MLPRFFKVIRYPHIDRLGLPSIFSSLYINTHIRCGSILLVFGNGKAWSVQLQMDGEKYVFTNGWLEVLSYIGLTTNDVVVFKATVPNQFEIKCFKNGLSGDAFCHVLLDNLPYLVIHDEFVERYWKKLRSGSLVTVKAINGLKWNLEVNTMLFFTLGGPGYSKMKKDLHLSHGNLIVFHQGPLYNLEVSVFQSDGLEIVNFVQPEATFDDEVIRISDDEGISEIEANQQLVPGRLSGGSMAASSNATEEFSVIYKLRKGLRINKKLAELGRLKIGSLIRIKLKGHPAWTMRIRNESKSSTTVRLCVNEWVPFMKDHGLQLKEKYKFVWHASTKTLILSPL